MSLLRWGKKCLQPSASRNATALRAFYIFLERIRALSGHRPRLQPQLLLSIEGNLSCTTLWSALRRWSPIIHSHTHRHLSRTTRKKIACTEACTKRTSDSNKILFCILSFSPSFSRLTIARLNCVLAMRYFEKKDGAAAKRRQEIFTLNYSVEVIGFVIPAYEDFVNISFWN